MRPLQRVVIALWAGSIWTVGFLAAPLLFASLPSHALAGMAARQLFMGVEYLGTGCGLILLGSLWAGDMTGQRRAAAGLVSVMLIVTVVSLLVIDPWLDNVRLADGARSSPFLWAHALASLTYGVLCLLALLLVVRSGRWVFTEA